MEGKNKTIVITASLEIFEMFTEAVNTRLASDGTDSFQVLLDTGDFQRKLTEGALEAEGQWSADILFVEKLGDVSEKESLITKAMGTRRICRKACEGDAGRKFLIYGYFFLPDYREEDEARSTNAYAALQRIEYNMMLEAPAYDDVILLSEDGRKKRGWFAEALIRLAVNGNESFEHSTLYKGWRQKKEEFLGGDQVLSGGLLKSTVLPEDSHSYSGMGYACVELKGTKRKGLGNLESQLFSKVNGQGWLRFGEELSDASWAEQVLHQLMGLGPDEELESFWEKYLVQPLKTCSVLEDNPVKLTREQINFEDTGAYAEGFRMEEKAKQGVQEITENLQSISENFLKNAKQVLDAYGPAALELLFYGKGNEKELSISNLCRQGMEHLEKIPLRKKKRPSQHITGAFSEQQTQERITEWKHYFRLAAETEIRAQAARPFLADEGEWDRLLVNPLKEFANRCGRMAKELEQEMTAEEAKEVSEETYAPEGEIPEFLSEWLPEYTRDTLDAMQVRGLKKALVCHLVNQAEPNRKASDIILEAVEHKSITLADCMENFAGNHTEAEIQEKCRRFARECCDYLLGKSAPVLAMDFESVRRSLWLILPQKILDGKCGGFIREEFEKYLDAYAGGRYEIIFSSCAEGILCYQSTVGNPLYELSGISKWEQAYNRRIAGETLDWKHYFPLALRHLNKNEIQKKLQEGFFNPCVEYALREKLIERKLFPGEDKKYLYVMNLLPDSWTNFDVSGYRVWDGEGKAQKGEPFFAYLHDRNSFSKEIWQREILLPGAGVFSKPYDFSEAMDGLDVEGISLSYMKRILQKNLPLFVKLRRTVKKYQMIQRDIDALKMEPEKKMKFCIYCGKALPKGTENFCPSCGRRLGQEQKQS